MKRAEKERRIEAAKRRQGLAANRLNKARRAMDIAEAEIEYEKRLIVALEALPVEDAPEPAE